MLLDRNRPHVSNHFQGGGSGAGEFSQMPDQKSMQVFPDFRVLEGAQGRLRRCRSGYGWSNHSQHDAKQAFGFIHERMLESTGIGVEGGCFEP